MWTDQTVSASPPHRTDVGLQRPGRGPNDVVAWLVNALFGLAQPTRLAILELLTSGDPDGLAAGEIARRIGIPGNTLSNHLAVLTKGDLVVAERRGRTIVYRSNQAMLERVAGRLDGLSKRS